MKGKFSLMWRVAIALVLAVSLSLVMAVPASAGSVSGVVVKAVNAAVGATTDYSIEATIETGEATDVIIDFSAFTDDLDLSGVSTDETDYTFTGFATDPTGVTVDDPNDTITFTGGTTTATTLHKIENAAAGTGLVIVNGATAETQSVTIDTTTDSGADDVSFVEVLSVTINSPTQSAPTYIYAGGSRDIKYAVTFTPTPTAGTEATVDVSALVANGTTIVSESFSVPSVVHNVEQTKNVTTDITATEGWYMLTVGAKVAAQGAYITDNEVNAVKVDNTVSTLESIVWNDVDTSGLIDVDDTIVFTFSEAMDTTTLDLATEVEDGLPVTGKTNQYGTDLADGDIDWNVGQDILTLTLGASPTIEILDTVNPTDAVKDRAGNLDATVDPGPALGETVRPTLNTIVFQDMDTSRTITGGDRLVFGFSEAMATSTVTADNIDTRLPITGTGTTYGSINAGLSLVWSGDSKTLTVTLGTDTDLAFGDTVDPADAVTDLAGNLDNTTAPGPDINASPYLVSILWTDVDNDGANTEDDTLTFTFSEKIDTSSLDTASEVNTNLPVSGGKHYGTNFADGDIAWNSPTDTILTLTMGTADDPTTVVGDTVNPEDAVTDVDSNIDATVAPGPAIPGDPKLSNIVWDDVDQDGSVEAGDTLEFVFSVAMDTTTITAANIDTRLLPSGSDESYGTAANGLVLDWSGDSKTLTVTLGTDLENIVSSDTVNPTTDVKDADGNTDVTLSPGPSLDDYPWLVSITWADVNGNETIDASDTLLFLFSEDMDKTTLDTAAELIARLPLSNGHSYGDIVDGNIDWTAPGGDDDFTLTLGANTTVADGDTVNPTDEVTDASTPGNADHTIAPGPSIQDATGPELDSFIYININENVGDGGANIIDAGDEVVFTFGEPMDTSTVTEQNVNSVLMSNGDHPFDYGTIDAGMSVAWNAAGDTLTVTLGTNGTIAVGDTVNPPDSVTDVAGNANTSGAIALTEAPWLESIVWNDVDSDGFITEDDTLVFTFQEAILQADLNEAAEVETGLPVTGKTDQYGTDFVNGDVVWTSATVLTLTMGADPTILQGDTVDPADAVLDDDDGNADATQVAKAVKNDANPAILTGGVVGTAVDAADDTIVITFNENVIGAAQAASWTVETGPDTENLMALVLTDAMFEYADATITAPATLTITLPEPTFYLVTGDMVRVTPVANAIVDVDDNAVTAAVDDAVITAEAVTPTFTIEATTVQEGIDTIVLTFIEYVKPASGNWNLVTAGADESEFASIKAGPAASLVDLDLTDATISPSDDSATITVTISLAEGVADLLEGQKAEVTLVAGAVDDLAGNAIGAADLDASDDTIGGDVADPTFTIGYYTDEALTTEVTVDYLKDGTYYLKITANEKLQAAPTISIVAEGSANDVTDAATTAVDGSQTVFRYNRVIYHDPAAVGEEIEQITLTGTDLAGNVVDAAVIGEKWTDTTAPSLVTLNSPNGGEQLVEGDVCTITWSATDTYMVDAELGIKLEYYDGTSWNTIIAETENDSTYSWAVPAVDSSSCMVRVTATDKAGNTRSDLSNSYFTISPVAVEPEEVTSIDLFAGWNFISVPKRMADDTNTFGELLATANCSTSYSYDPDTGWHELLSDTPVEVLEGYWINANEEGTIYLSYEELGQAVPASKELEGNAWNAIGPSSTTTQTAEDTLKSIEGSWSTIIGWDADGGAYEDSIIADGGGNMIPGKGYWIWMTAEDVLSAISG